jgi:urease accessory protein
MMNSKTRYFQLLSVAVLAQPLVAVAHPMHWLSESMGFVGGMVHPFTGSDHIVALLAVGFWLSQLNRRAVTILPLVFIVLMLFGCSLTLAPIEIAHAENIMNLSALLLGLLLASGYKVSSYTVALITGNLAVFHGYVHAYDIWLDIDGLAYTAGFIFTTLALIAMGVGIRSIICRFILKNVAYYREIVFGDKA